jgi:WD40 repeat protein
MFRFIATCTLIAALCVGAVLLLKFGLPDIKAEDDPKGRQRAGGQEGNGRQPAADDVKPDVSDSGKSQAAVDDDKAVSIKTFDADKSAAQPLIFQEARVLAAQRQDVPSERDGKLLFLATPVKLGEYVPPSKLIEFEVPTLAVKVPTLDAWRALPEEERLIDVDSPKKFFVRAVRYTDTLEPNTTVVIRQKLRFRKLELGDPVRKGQMLGVINPALAMEDLYIKQTLIDVAASEIKQSLALYDEYTRRAASMNKLRGRIQGGVTDDDYFATLATATKYKEEARAKEAGQLKAQRELSQALTTLKMHSIRASIDGVIKNVYKQSGESVKNLEPVVQIQNLKDLRVEAQVEVQVAMAARKRLEQARTWRDEAAKAEEAAERNPTQARQYLAHAKRLREDADKLLEVAVEASRVEPPLAVLSGHLQEVTCVAVSGERPRDEAQGHTRRTPTRILSGSEDNTVRIWEGGQGHWEERARLDHHAPVRAIACTAPSAKRNLLLTGTSTGRARLFELGDEGAKEVVVGKEIVLGKRDERHTGPVNAVAFSADGKVCATGGEDRSICLWETDEGKLLGRVRGAHQSAVTSLTFTARGQLVSVGRDRRLVVWDVAGEGDGKKLEQALVFDHRSNDVQQLGVDDEGARVLFDEGREIRVMSLDSRKIEGRLANAPGAPSFSTLALYSPDGNTILTNGNAAGRLQLWRAPTAKYRASELRQFAWSSGKVTSAAFEPSRKDGNKGKEQAESFVATGTTDSRVLVWSMPKNDETEKGPLVAHLSYVEEFLDTSLKRVAVRVTLDNPPDWVIPGSSATIVVQPRTK